MSTFCRVSLLFTTTNDPGRGYRRLWIGRTEGAVGFDPLGIECDEELEFCTYAFVVVVV